MQMAAVSRVHAPATCPFFSMAYLHGHYQHHQHCKAIFGGCLMVAKWNGTSYWPDAEKNLWQSSRGRDWTWHAKRYSLLYGFTRAQRWECAHGVHKLELHSFTESILFLAAIFFSFFLMLGNGSVFTFAGNDLYSSRTKAMHTLTVLLFAVIGH